MNNYGPSPTFHAIIGAASIPDTVLYTPCESHLAPQRKFVLVGPESVSLSSAVEVNWDFHFDHVGLVGLNDSLDAFLSSA